MVKAVLFDLDGTLVNTLTELAASTNALLTELGLPTHPESAYRVFVGNGARRLIVQASGIDDEAMLDDLVRRFLTEYDRRLCESRPYDGVVQTLDALIDQGVRMAVVTNKPHEQAVRLTRHLFGDRFVTILGGCDAYPKKPDSQVVRMALAKLGVDAEDCVFVGDSDVDVYTAHNAGMPCIGCAFGFRGETELKAAGADDIVYSFAQLQKNQLIFE